MKGRDPLRYEQTPYEEKRWNAAEAAWRQENQLAARLFREAAALASDEWRQDCLDKAEMFERRAERLFPLQQFNLGEVSR